MLYNISLRRKKSFTALWCAGIAAVFTFHFCNQNDYIRDRTGGSNMVQYAALCAAFLMVYLAVTMILTLKVFDRERLMDVLCVVSAVSVAGFLYICWTRDVQVANSQADTYIWHMYPEWLVFACLAVLTLLYEAVARHIDFGKDKWRYCIFLYYGAITFLGGYLNYFLDYLNVDSFHGSAIFNSVYNVMHGVPYEEVSNSVYGNYALLLALPMKIFGGGTYFNLGRVMCVLTMVCIALGIYVIHTIVGQKEIRFLCATALIWPSVFRKTNYWQLYPMRIIWPIILLAWLVFLNKRESSGKTERKWMLSIVTYLILVLSVVWNKESGVVCLIGYLAYSFVKGVAACLTKDGSKIWGTLLECLLMTSSVAAAFVMVGVYNLIVAGKWITWEVFFFPLFTKAYMTGDIMLRLEKGIWPWMAVAFVFLSVVCRVGIRLLHREEMDYREYIYVAASVIGLGLMTYFMNRPVYMNLTISYYEALICIGGLTGSLNRKEYGALISTFMRAVSMTVLAALVTGELLRLGTVLYYDRGTDRQEILALRDAVREDTEEDTYAFGVNIPELYSLLGWETRSYTTDWADVFITRELILCKLYKDLESEDVIMTDERTFDRYEDVKEYVSERFYIDKTYPYNDKVVFYLMKRK